MSSIHAISHQINFLGTALEALKKRVDELASRPAPPVEVAQPQSQSLAKDARIAALEARIAALEKADVTATVNASIQRALEGMATTSTAIPPVAGDDIVLQPKKLAPKKKKTTSAAADTTSTLESSAGVQIDV
jgi:hypothetical protein